MNSGLRPKITISNDREMVDCMFDELQSFALITGQHMKLFRCSNTSDPHVIGSLVQGAAMDGCFCCFDDTHMLKKEIWSVLFSNVQSIVQAIRTLSTYCLLPGGREVM